MPFTAGAVPPSVRWARTARLVVQSFLSEVFLLIAVDDDKNILMAVCQMRTLASQRRQQ
jgi:hypothetical protein